VLNASLSLIQQHLLDRVFDSAMVSFAAMLAWDSTKQTWRDVNNYTPYLSQLIYDCQIVVLSYCLDLIGSGGARSMTRCIVSIRDEWLLNDTAGPVAELSGYRLLGFEIGRDTVNQAQMRWHGDENTIVYKDVQLTMDQVKELVAKELHAARDILERDLCFGMEGAPLYEPAELVDNWDASMPGQSFLTDTRNAPYLSDGQTWIFDQLRLRPELMKLMYRARSKHHDGTGSWQLSSNAVAEYENAVQHFLESMMVLTHVASGQPARRPELLGLRVCNRQADKRNIFVHNGHIIFILTYHKSLNIVHASRYPLRVLLPEVAVLLLQYLVLVLPFRAWLAKETTSSENISEYLWHDGKEVWSEDKMTRVFLSRTTQAIGVRVNVQAWRQIAVGIAIKKLSGQSYQHDLDLAADGFAGGEREGETAESGGGMPEAMRW